MKALPLLLSLFFCSVLLAAEKEVAAEEARFDLETYQLAPVYIHLLASESEPALHTTLQESDIERIFRKVNGVWSQAGLGFYIAAIVREPPAAIDTDESDAPARPRSLLSVIPEKSYRAGQFNLYYIKQFGPNGTYFPRAIFVKDTASLRKVEGGIDEPIPRVTSHELGHALGLPHRQETFNLMASGTTGTTLNEQEIEAARKTARELGRFRSAAELLAETETLEQAARANEALRLRQALAALPLDAAPLRELRERLAKPSSK